MIATGVGHTVREFVDAAFRHAGNRRLVFARRGRPRVRAPGPTAADLTGDASRARAELGWTPTVGFDEIVGRMVDADLSATPTPR